MVDRVIVVTPRYLARAWRVPRACLARAGRVHGACLARAWRVRMRGKSMHGALLDMATYA